MSGLKSLIGSKGYFEGFVFLLGKNGSRSFVPHSVEAVFANKYFYDQIDYLTR